MLYEPLAVSKALTDLANKRLKYVSTDRSLVCTRIENNVIRKMLTGWWTLIAHSMHASAKTKSTINEYFVDLFQAQSDDDDVADDVSVNVGGPDDFMTEFFAEVSIQSVQLRTWSLVSKETLFPSMVSHRQETCFLPFFFLFRFLDLFSDRSRLFAPHPVSLFCLFFQLFHTTARQYVAAYYTYAIEGD